MPDPEESCCWWVEESWPGPPPVTEEDIFQIFASFARAYGKSFAEAAAHMQSVMESFHKVLRPEIKPNLNKSGPVTDSVRLLTALRGRDNVQGCRRSQPQMRSQHLHVRRRRVR